MNSHRCPSCGVTKPVEDFPRDKRRRSGRACYCKPCHNEKNRHSKQRNGGARRYHLRKRYGVEPAQVETMVAEQGGMCVVCRVNVATQVDHDHETGRVRGILCGDCNNGLGAFRDDPEIVMSAIDYLSGKNPGAALS